MGVDFDTCDTCGETTCDENITYMNVVGLGSYKTCTICRDHEKYFTPTYESKERILQKKRWGISFAACILDIVNPTKKDICFSSRNIEEFKEYTKNAQCLVGYMFESDKIEDDVYFHPDVETMLSEAYDVLFDEEKEGVFMNVEIQWEASEKWKKIMMERLDDEIECLKIKRRKFNSCYNK
jgi:hypothetical protein